MGALQAAGHFYNADRVYVLEMDLEMQIGVNTYEWCSDNAPAALDHAKTIPLELTPRLEQYLKMNQPMIIEDIERIKERYGIDFSLKMDKARTPPRYFVFFKAKDADTMKAAFTEYTANSVKKKKPSVRKKLELAKKRKPLHRERVRQKTKERTSSL